MSSETVDPSAQIRRLVERGGGKFCERCKCCEMLWQDCDECAGEGEYECADEWEDEVLTQCTTCGGCGGWWVCGCNEKGEHEERAT